MHNESLKTELEKSRLAHNRETKARCDADRRIQEQVKIIWERDNEITKNIEELNDCNENIQNLDDDNNKLFSELEKMKNHILVLTEQNQAYCDELDSIVEQDEKMKAHLNKRERVSLLKSSNKFLLEKSLSNLDQINTSDNSRGFNVSKNLSLR